MKPLARARLALEGLCTGDAFGDQLPRRLETTAGYIANRQLPPPPWRWTDDSNMAFSIFENLRQFVEIRQDALAQSFATHYDIARGYGASMHRRLGRIRDGEYWKHVNQTEPFQSYGNGGAMRVAPVGAYFADNLTKVVDQAQKSAEVTHSHPEGIAGAVAIAVAAAYAWQTKSNLPTRNAFLEVVHQYTPDSEVREKIRHAIAFDEDVSVRFVAETLGNGKMITAQDTVPFTLWCAAGNLNNYEEALWTTISESGDPDTNCAIVGGIVAMSAAIETIPQAWRESREPFPDWLDLT